MTTLPFDPTSTPLPLASPVAISHTDAAACCDDDCCEAGCCGGTCCGQVIGLSSESAAEQTSTWACC